LASATRVFCPDGQFSIGTIEEFAQVEIAAGLDAPRADIPDRIEPAEHGEILPHVRRIGISHKASNSSAAHSRFRRLASNGRKNQPRRDECRRHGASSPCSAQWSWLTATIADDTEPTRALPRAMPMSDVPERAGRKFDDRGRNDFESLMVDMPIASRCGKISPCSAALCGQESARRIEALAADLDLSEFLDRPNGKTVVRQKTRVALAKALINQPELAAARRADGVAHPDTATGSGSI